jgi:two-component system sensor histidine kinase/response regulator
MTWSPAALTDRLGGDADLARELVDIFLAEYPNLLQAIFTSIDRGDAPALRRAAHALRGSVTNFIDDGPTATALAIEQAAEASRLDDAEALGGQLKREIDALAAAMRGTAGTD